MMGGNCLDIFSQRGVVGMNDSRNKWDRMIMVGGYYCSIVTEALVENSIGMAGQEEERSVTYTGRWDS
jgi:hypothetical protein